MSSDTVGCEGTFAIFKFVKVIWNMFMNKNYNYQSIVFSLYQEKTKINYSDKDDINIMIVIILCIIIIERYEYLY